jgi:uncharacterized protein (TIGR03435 family)
MASAWAQQPPEAKSPPLQFEVASVKPSAPDARGMFIRPGPGGGMSITNMALKELIVIAYRIQPFQISGGPSWISSNHYDVIAKPESRPSPGDNQLMLQALLADRFQLVIHRETKELPVYALVLARKDGKLGPGLVPAKEGGCQPPDPNKLPPPLEPGKPPTLGCGEQFLGISQLKAVSAPITNLLFFLSRMLGRSVIDKTGLTGKFDITATWTPDETQAAAPLPPDAPKLPSGDVGPSIFTAFQEQLGLKLEAQKGPVEMLVIDRAEKPSEN